MSTLLLSGWAQPVDALNALAGDAVTFDYSDYDSVDAAIAAMPQAHHVIGWSTGGYLALHAIAAGKLRPKHLTLLAAPHQFVSDVTTKGMDPLTFQLFRESYANDPVRTKVRFHALVAKGDSEQRRIAGELQHHSDVGNTARWLPWLDALAAQAVQVSTLASAPPTLIIHGMNDAIVPHTQGEFLTEHLPNTQLSSWADVGHAPHLHDAGRAKAEISAHRDASCR